jgi:hypothetical protein
MTEINQIQAVADTLGTESLTATVANFSVAINNIDGQIVASNPAILELISQIYALFLELSQLTY